jgi:diguanylate cyclase (GGDEF)-like protein
VTGVPCWLVDLSSDLRLEHVLDRILENALGALPGRDLALLVGLDGELSAVRTSRLGPGARRRVEEWVRSDPALLAEPREVGELGGDPDLERLALRLDAGQLRSQPLVIDGHSLGILVVLAKAVEPLTDEERELLADFALQAAIALRNAHLFQELSERATQDPLTGLANRRELDRMLARELERSSRYGEIFSVALIDLDGFKQLNDRRGHPAGDALLRQAAATIDEACRAADAAARLGGDEFVLILPQTNQFEAAALCERLRAEIETLGEVSLSWGIAEYPTHGVDARALIRAADAAMYAAKPRAPASTVARIARAR